MSIIDSKALAQSVDAYCSFFGISKKDFHRDSGISSATLSQWRSGTYEPDKRSLTKLEQYTSLSIDDLLSGNLTGVSPPKGKKITDTRDVGKNSEIHIYFNQLFDQLTLENQLRAVEMLQKLKLEQLTQDFPKESD